MAVNVLAWAMLGVIDSDPADRLTVVRVSIIALHTLTGVLFPIRRPLRRAGSWWLCSQCLPSFLACGLAFYLAPAPHQWPAAAAALFAAGTALACLAFFFLGRGFAVLPADRGTVTRGPYRFIRHPAYAGELAMVAACFAARPGWLVLLPCLAAVPLVVMRILAEERLLLRSAEYRIYVSTVAWRLIPGVW